MTTTGSFTTTTVALGVATGAGIGAVVASIAEWSDRSFGTLIAISLLAIGVALVSWSKALPIDEEVVEQRHELRIVPEEQAEFDAEAELTRQTVGRRPALLWMFGGAVGAMALAVISPILSLGPSITSSRRSTSWVAGRRLVGSDGAPIAAESVRFDELVTVFPEGHRNADDSQVVLLRLPPDELSDATLDGGAVDGWVAYSKICTHLGCSVGLFGIDDREPQTLRQLVCPCHQSIFDPTHGAEPVGGPAPRPLPQLPLGVDDDGFLIALGDFPIPVGPATWDEG